MSWTRGAPLSDAHRDRLLAAGTLQEVLDRLALRQVMAPLPHWWHEQGNALYLHDDVAVPRPLVEAMALIPLADWW